MQFSLLASRSKAGRRIGVGLATLALTAGLGVGGAAVAAAESEGASTTAGCYKRSWQLNRHANVYASDNSYKFTAWKGNRFVSYGAPVNGSYWGFVHTWDWDDRGDGWIYSGALTYRGCGDY